MKPFFLIAVSYFQFDARALEFREQVQTVKIPVTRSTIRPFGREVFAQLVHDITSDADGVKFSGFTASEECLRKLVARYNLDNTALHEQAGSVDDEEVAALKT